VPFSCYSHQQNATGCRDILFCGREMINIDILKENQIKQEYLSDLITALVKLNLFLAHLGILDLSIGF